MTETTVPTRLQENKGRANMREAQGGDMAQKKSDPHALKAAKAVQEAV